MCQHLYNKNSRLVGSFAVLAALAGCQPAATAYAPPEGYYPMYYPQGAAAPGYAPDAANIEPAAGPVAAPMPTSYQPIAAVSQQQLSQVDAAFSKMDERLQRVEKAMLRLDRRMQLVERNELNRMTDAEPAKTSALGTGQGGFAAAGSEGMTYSAGFQPVSAITSSLQAAPARNQLNPQTFEAFDAVAASNTRASTSSFGGMRSLADEAPTASAPSADNELAIWTVNYGTEKVWPERAELPGSRDVVAALKAGKPVTVFARGKQPNAVMFRERVKAISQYLGKASNQESVPIAALPGSHLGNDTVEIFATY